MSGKPHLRLLDISRLIRRVGRRMTGVDRVELAYFEYLQQDESPLFGLVRTTLGYILLGPDGMAQILARFQGEAWGPVDVLSRVSRKRSDMQRRAESDVRRFACARCRPSKLGKMLGKHLGEGFSYVNVGHSNLTERVLWTMRHKAKARIAVMIHDTIPLDHPEFQAEGPTDKFRAKLRRVRAYADLILCNSADTQSRVGRHMAAWGDLPEMVVSHLGVEVPESDLLSEFEAPYFICVGTIEPRKNVGFLLDVWQEFEAPPLLLLCGSRGWKNEKVFHFLDNMDPNGPIREMPDLEDEALFGLMRGAAGVLFPSMAEGYGLPPIEAAALNVPVICNDLPVYREVLGDIPVYASVTDSYQWVQIIEKLVQEQATGQTRQNKEEFIPPSWDDHFNAVLRLI